ncbi:MAG: folate-binding protein [Methylotenera sp.]
MTATEWQTSLATQDAVIENGVVMHFGNPSAELLATTKTNVLCDLTHLGLLEINGADAASFLQGQVTNDVKLLVGNNAHYTAYCNPKGRMLALFLAFAHHNHELGGHLHLQLNRELLEPIMKRLKMYVMRSKVEIKDVSDSPIKFGLNGPEAAKLLVPLFTKAPSQDYELLSLENGAILKLPATGNNTRFEVFTDAANAPTIWNALKAECQLVGKPCWDWLEIQAGIPDITSATQEQFVPQMLNLDLLNAISFKKGCYTGQEIVARTHYLGSVKRRTYLASIESDRTPLAGDKVMDGTKNEVGQIVRAAANPSGSFDALVEMRIDAKEAGSIYWNDAVVTTKNLPYALES